MQTHLVSQQGVVHPAGQQAKAGQELLSVVCQQVDLQVVWGAQAAGRLLAGDLLLQLVEGLVIAAQPVLR